MTNDQSVTVDSARTFVTSAQGNVACVVGEFLLSGESIFPAIFGELTKRLLPCD